MFVLLQLSDTQLQTIGLQKAQAYLPHLCKKLVDDHPQVFRAHSYNQMLSLARQWYQYLQKFPADPSALYQPVLEGALIGGCKPPAPAAFATALAAALRQGHHKEVEKLALLLAAGPVIAYHALWFD